MKKRKMIADTSKDIEFLERMASVTEELEDLVEISKGKKKLESPLISRGDVSTLFKAEKKRDPIPKALLSVFRLLVVKNLVRGRLFATVYNSGKEIGLSVSVRSKKEFIKVTRRLGIGKVEVSKLEPSSVKINLYNGITSLGVKHSPRPICFFEAGIFSGLIENILRKKVNLREVKCRTKGDHCCQFELSRLEYVPQKSHPVYPIDIYPEENLKLLTSLATHSIAAIENTILFEKTRRQVVIDGLTQVYNHRYFHTRSEVEIKRAKRYQFPITVFMLDIDNFKHFNDVYGHPKGDEILKEVAKAIVKNLRDVDIVARYGGDEFAAVLPQTGEEGARIVARRIGKEVTLASKKIRIKKKKAHVTISLGGITVEPSALKARHLSLVEIADKALLRAKRKGKNNIVLVKKA